MRKQICATKALTVLVCSQLVSPISVLAEDLKLDSADKTVSAAPLLEAHGVASSQILQSGEHVTLTTGDLLTPAQSVALSQVLSSGNQTLLLGAQGQAVGGSLNIAPASFGNLVIPHGVTAISDFGSSGALSISQSLSNAGTLLAISSNPQITTASILSGTILNNGTITSVLPATLSGYSNLVANLSLSLTALQSIVNYGTISSAANLSMSAPTIQNLVASPASLPIMQAVQNLNMQALNIVNQGVLASQTADINAVTASLTNRQALLQSLTGNVNLTSFGGSGLSVDNTAGTIQAARNLSIRAVLDQVTGGSGDLGVAGGFLSGNEIFFEALHGHAGIAVQDLQGPVNVSACTADFRVTEGTHGLVLNSFNISGDPNLVFSGSGPFVWAGFNADGGFVDIDTSGDLVNGSITFTGDIVTTPLLPGGSNFVSLRAGTFINAQNIITSGNTFGNGGAVFLSANTNINALNIDTSGAGGAISGNLDVQAGNAVTLGDITAGNVDIQAGTTATLGNISSGNLDVNTGSALSLAGGSGLTATFLAGGTATFNGDYSANTINVTASSITAAAGVDLTAGTVGLTSLTGNIGSAVNRLGVDGAATASATSGSIFLSSSTNLALGASSAAGKLDVLASGSLSTTGNLSAGSVALSTTGGVLSIGSTVSASNTVDINSNSGNLMVGSAVSATNALNIATTTGSLTVNAAVTSSTSTVGLATTTGALTIAAPVSGNAVTLTTTSGDVSGAGSISANTVAFSSGSGSLGTAGTPMTVAAASAFSANTGGAGNVFVSHTGAASLNASSAGNEFNLSATGAINVNGNLSGALVSLAPSLNSNLAVNANISGTTALNLTVQGTGSLVAAPGVLLTSPAITVTVPNNNIGSAGNRLAVSGGISLNTSGSAFLSSPGNYTIGASTVGGNLDATSSGTLGTSGNISASNVSLQTTTGSIDIGSQLTALTAISIQTTTGSVTGSGALNANSVTFSSTSGSFGAIGVPLSVASSSFSATTGGAADVVVLHTGVLNLGASTAGNRLQFTSSAGINVNGVLSASDLRLTAGNNSNLSINANLTGTAKMVLVAQGTGDISAPGKVLTSASTTLISGTGGIGSALNPLSTVTSSLSTTTGGGSAFINNTGALSITALNTTVSGDFIATSSGTITLTNGGTGDDVSLTATAGNIRQTGGTLTANTLALSTPAGDIGTGAAPVTTSAGTLLVNAGAGGAYFSQAKAVSVLPGAVSGAFSLTAAGNVSLGAISGATDLTVQTSANGSISLVGSQSATNSITLNAGGSGAISAPAGVLTAPASVSLISGSGDIGASISRVTTDTSSLTATTSGNVYVTNKSAAVTLANAGPSATYSVYSEGDLTVGSITAGTIDIGSVAGNGNVTLTTNITAATSVQLRAHGTGAVSQTAGLITATTVTFSSGQSGSAGSAATPLNLGATVNNVSANTGGSAYFLSANTGTSMVDTSTTGGTLQFQAPGSITVIGDVDAGTLWLESTASNGNILLTADTKAVLNGTLIANGSGTILQSGGFYLIGGNLDLRSGSGDIGKQTPYPPGGKPPNPDVLNLWTQADGVKLTTTGNVFLHQFGAKALNISGATVGNKLEIRSTSADLNVTGALNLGPVPLTGAGLYLETGTGNVNFTVDISTTPLTVGKGGSVYIEATTGNVTINNLDTSGNESHAGDIEIVAGNKLIVGNLVASGVTGPALGAANGGAIELAAGLGGVVTSNVTARAGLVGGTGGEIEIYSLGTLTSNGNLDISQITGSSLIGGVKIITGKAVSITGSIMSYSVNGPGGTVAITTPSTVTIGGGIDTHSNDSIPAVPGYLDPSGGDVTIQTSGLVINGDLHTYGTNFAFGGIVTITLSSGGADIKGVVDTSSANNIGGDFYVFGNATAPITINSAGLNTDTAINTSTGGTSQFFAGIVRLIQPQSDITITGSINTTSTFTGGASATAGDIALSGNTLLVDGNINASNQRTSGGGVDLSARGNLTLTGYIDTSGGVTGGAGGGGVIMAAAGTTGNGDLLISGSVTSTGRGAAYAGGSFVALATDDITTSSISLQGVGGAKGGAVAFVSGSPVTTGDIITGDINTSGSNGGLTSLISMGTSGTLTAGNLTTDATAINGSAGSLTVSGTGKLVLGNISARSVVAGSTASYGGSIVLTSGDLNPNSIVAGNIDTSAIDYAGNIFTVYNVGSSSAVGAITQSGVTPGFLVDGSPVANPPGPLPTSITGDMTIRFSAGGVENFNPGGFITANAPGATLSIDTAGDSRVVIPVVVRSGNVNLQAINSVYTAGAPSPVAVYAAGAITVNTSVNASTPGGIAPPVTFSSNIGVVNLASINVSGDPGGTIIISTPAQFNLANGNTLLANSISGKTAGGRVLITVPDGMINLGSAGNTTAGAMIDVSGATGGLVQIEARDNINIYGGRIDATGDTGSGGTVDIASYEGSVNFFNSFAAGTYYDSSINVSSNTGDGGVILIYGKTGVSVDKDPLLPGPSTSLVFNANGFNRGGSIDINAPFGALNLTDALAVTATASNIAGIGGTVTLFSGDRTTTTDVNVSADNAGSVVVVAGGFQLVQGYSVLANSSAGAGGSISIYTQGVRNPASQGDIILSQAGNTSLNSVSATGTTNGGQIQLLSGRDVISYETSILATGGTGKGGTITVSAGGRDVQLYEMHYDLGVPTNFNANVDASSASANGGTIQIGARSNVVSLRDTTITGGTNSSTATILASGPSGGGQISVNAGVSTGAGIIDFSSTDAIRANSSLPGSKGGAVALLAPDALTSVEVDASGASGGTITGSAGFVTLVTGESLNARGTAGAGGTISLAATKIDTSGPAPVYGTIVLGTAASTNNSFVSASGTTNGGAVTLSAPGDVISREVSLSAAGGTGAGGSISVSSVNQSIRLEHEYWQDALLVNYNLNADLDVSSTSAAGGTITLSAATDISSVRDTSNGFTGNVNNSVINAAGSTNGGTISITSTTGGVNFSETNLISAGASGPGSTGGAITIASNKAFACCYSKTTSSINAAGTTNGGDISITSTTGTIDLTSTNNVTASGSGSTVGGKLTLSANAAAITTSALNAQGAGGKITVTAGGTLTNNDGVSGDQIVWRSVANNGAINLGADITGAASVTIDANGSGAIAQLAGVVKAPFVTLISGTGNIGAVTGGATPPVPSLDPLFIHVDTGNLSASTAGDVYLNSISSSGVNLLNSNAGTLYNMFMLQSAGTVNVTGTVTSGGLQTFSFPCCGGGSIDQAFGTGNLQIDTYANDGNITVSGFVRSGFTSLTTHGTGGVTILPGGTVTAYQTTLITSETLDIQGTVGAKGAYIRVIIGGVPLVDFGLGTTILIPSGSQNVSLGGASTGLAPYEITAAQMENLIDTDTLMVGSLATTGNVVLSGNVDLTGAGPEGVYSLNIQTKDNYTATGKQIVFQNAGLANRSYSVNAGGTINTGSTSGAGSTSFTAVGDVNVDGDVSSTSFSSFTSQSVVNVNAGKNVTATNSIFVSTPSLVVDGAINTGNFSVQHSTNLPAGPQPAFMLNVTGTGSITAPTMSFIDQHIVAGVNQGGNLNVSLPQLNGSASLTASLGADPSTGNISIETTNSNLTIPNITGGESSLKLATATGFTLQLAAGAAVSSKVLDLISPNVVIDKNISATAGNLTISSPVGSGLTLSSTTAAVDTLSAAGGNVIIRATDGPLSIQSAFQTVASTTVLDGTSVGGSVALTAGGAVSASGDLQVMTRQSLNNAGSLVSGSALNISSATTALDVTNSGTLTGGSILTVTNAGGALTLQNTGAIGASGTLSITNSGGVVTVNNAGSLASAAGQLQITNDQDINIDNSNGAATSGTVSGATGVTLTSSNGNLNLLQGSLAGTLTAGAKNTIDIETTRNGETLSVGSVTAPDTRLTVTDGSTLRIGNGAVVTTDTFLGQAGNFIVDAALAAANGALVLESRTAGMTITGGAGGSLSATTGTTLRAADGILQVAGSIGVGGPLLVASSGPSGQLRIDTGVTLSATGAVTVNTPVVSNDGTLSTPSTISLSAPSLTVSGSGSMSANTISFTGTAGDVTVTQSVLSGTVQGNSSNNLSLTANGAALNTGNISATGSVALSAANLDPATGTTISGASVTLTATSGSIGASGDELTLSTPILNAVSSGSDVYIVNSGSALTIGSPLTAPGAIVVVNSNAISTSAGISGGSVSLQANTGDLTLGGNVDAASVTLTAKGAGAILQPGGVITAASVTLNTGSGNIGSNVAAIDTASATVTASTTGDLWITNTGNLTTTLAGKNGVINNTGAIALTSSTMSADLQVTTSGDLSNTGVVSGTNITLSGANATFQDNVNASANLTVNASGGISQTAGRLTAGGKISLTAPNIGSALNTINIDGNSLTLSTPGSAYISDLNNLVLGATSATNVLSITAGGTLSTTAGQTVSADSITLQTGAGSNGAITLNSNVSGTSAVTITADGSGAVGWNNGTVSAAKVTLASGSGNIGSAGSPVQTSTPDLTVSTSGVVFVTDNVDMTLTATVGDATLTETGNLTLGSITATGKLTANASGSITVAQTFSGGGLGLSAGAGVALNANLSGGVITIASGADIDQTAGLTITATQLSLTANGAIGAVTPLTTLSPVLNLTANGVIQLNNTGNTSLGASGSSVLINNTGTTNVTGGNSTTNFTLNSTNTISVSAAVNAVDVQLSTSAGSGAGINVSAAVTASGNLTIDPDGAGTFNNSGAVQWSGVATIGSSTIVNNGSLTSNTAGAALSLGENGALTLSGTGSINVNNAGLVLGGNGFANVSLGGTQTINTGAGGTFAAVADSAGGNLAFANNAAYIVNSGSPVSLSAPVIRFGNSSSLNTSGSALNLQPGAPAGALTVFAPDAGVSTITSGGGAITVQSGAGAPVNFSLAGPGPSTINFNGGALDLSGASINVQSSVTVQTDNSLTLNSSTINNSGGLIATQQLNAQTANNLVITGTGTIGGSNGTNLSSANGSVSLTQASVTGVLTGSAATSYTMNLTAGDLTITSLQAQGGDLSVTNNGNLVTLLDQGTLSSTNNVAISGRGGVTIGSVGGQGAVLNAGQISGAVDPVSTDMADYDYSAITSPGHVWITSANGDINIGQGTSLMSRGDSVGLSAGGNITVQPNTTFFAQGGNVWLNALGDINIPNGTSLTAVARTLPFAGMITIDNQLIQNYVGGSIGMDVDVLRPAYDAFLRGIELNRTGSGIFTVTSGVTLSGTNTFNLTNGSTLQFIATNIGSIGVQDSTFNLNGGVVSIDPPTSNINLNNVMFAAVGPLLNGPPAPPPVIGGGPAPVIVAVAGPAAVVPVVAAPSTPSSSIIIPLDTISIPDAAGQSKAVQHDTSLEIATPTGAYLYAQACQPFVMQDDDDTVIIGEPGTMFRSEERQTAIATSGDRASNAIAMQQGRLLIMAGKRDVVINTVSGSVVIPKGSTSVVSSSEAGVLKVTSVSGEASKLTPTASSESLIAVPGQEVVIADESVSEDDLIPIDGIDRKMLVSGAITVKGGRSVRYAKNSLDLADLWKKDRLFSCRLDELYRRIRNKRTASTPQLQSYAMPERTTSEPADVLRPVAFPQMINASGVKSLSSDYALLKFGRSSDVVMQSPQLFVLHEGDLIVNARKDTVVKSGSATIHVKAGVLALVQNTNSVVKVHVFHDRGPNSVRVSADRGLWSTTLSCGQQAVVAVGERTLGQALETDKVARRRMLRFNPAKDLYILTCEASLLSVVSSCDLIGRIMKSAHDDDRCIANRVIRTGAILGVITGGHGQYQVTNRN